MPKEQEIQQHTRLVHRGALDLVLKELRDKEQVIIAGLERVVQEVPDPEPNALLVEELAQARKRLKALEAGFIPIAGNWQ